MATQTQSITREITGGINRLRDPDSAFTVTDWPDGSVWIEIRGQLVVGNRQELKRTILDDLETGRRHFTIDLSHCDYVDCTGLGVLLGVSKRVREADGSLELVNLGEDLLTLFELTKLDLLLNIRSAAAADR